MAQIRPVTTTTGYYTPTTVTQVAGGALSWNIPSQTCLTSLDGTYAQSPAGGGTSNQTTLLLLGTGFGVSIPTSAYNVSVLYDVAVGTGGVTGRTGQASLGDGASTYYDTQSGVSIPSSIAWMNGGANFSKSLTAAQVNAGLGVGFQIAAAGGTAASIQCDAMRLAVQYTIDVTSPSAIRTVMLEKFREGWERVFGRRDWETRPSGLALPFPARLWVP